MRLPPMPALHCGCREAGLVCTAIALQSHCLLPNPEHPCDGGVCTVSLLHRHQGQSHEHEVLVVCCGQRACMRLLVTCSIGVLASHQR